MPSFTSQQRAEFLVKKRGYIVLVSREGLDLPPGHIKNHVNFDPLGQPFVIVGETTREDALEQTRLLVEAGDDTPEITENSQAKYYKLVTD